MDLITSCTAIIDDTFFKKRTAHGKCFSSEFRRNNTTLPVEIHVRKVDPGNALVLIGTEDSFIINSDKAFELRPEFTDLCSKLLKDIDSLGSADCKNNDITESCAMISVKISHIAKTVDQSLSTCNDVTDHQCAVRHHSKLAVFDLQTCDLFFFKYTLTGKKADIMNTDMLSVACLFQRIVQRASKNRKNICCRNLLLFLQIIKHLRSRRNKAVVYLITYYFRCIQKLS